MNEAKQYIISHTMKRCQVNLKLAYVIVNSICFQFQNQTAGLIKVISETKYSFSFCKI